MHSLPNFDIINNNPVDYMHCVLLGVVKQRLLPLWFDSVYHRNPWYVHLNKHVNTIYKYHCQEEVHKVYVNETLPILLCARCATLYTWSVSIAICL